jgi:hypothetical protein
MFGVNVESSIGDDSVDDNSYLFQSSSDHDLLSLPLPNGASDSDFDFKDPNSIHFAGFDTFMTEQYHESRRSSEQFGDLIDVSDTVSATVNGKEHAEITCPPEPATLINIKGDFGNGRSSQHAIPMQIPPTSSGHENEEDGESTDHYSTRNHDHNESASASSVVAARNERFPSTASSALDSQRQVRESTPPTPFSQDSPSGGISGMLHSPGRKSYLDLKPRSSIPPHISSREFGAQSVLAAYASRLDPFALHKAEFEMLKDHITLPEVTIYLNIRNAILRLWTRNPRISVSRTEALGCAKDVRYFELADIAYTWLIRNGYINFGCLEIHNTAGPVRRIRKKPPKQRTVVVVGAGVAGLSSARQLSGLFAQLGNFFTEHGEKPPRIIVLEGRKRIGGRVYSHPLRDQHKANLPGGLRSTAEMGAQIVTGFEHGNPLNIILRGQLGLRYHALRDNTVLYDHDGSLVDREKDVMAEALYNDILERASIYRHQQPTVKTIKGDEDSIWYSKDPEVQTDVVLSALEEPKNEIPVSAPSRGSKKTGKERLAGRAYLLSTGDNCPKPAAEAAEAMGWTRRAGVTRNRTLDLLPITTELKHPTLGHTMDEAIRQYQDLIDLKPIDMRLLNWHHANLEYANAVNVNQLSLGGWDQDIGNEFEGVHSEVIGGYTQVPRGLWKCPTPLDIRFDSAVRKIVYGPDGHDFGKLATVECHNGAVYEADAVILTAPLGVLKSGSINFEPALPKWKAGAIERLGFGLLNKVC